MDNILVGMEMKRTASIYTLNTPTKRTAAFGWKRWMTTVLVACCAVAVSDVVHAQESPHGDLRFACAACHSTDSWTLKKDRSFSHDATGFALTGQHARLQCRTCHGELQFSKASSDCRSCHTDVHKSELGANCVRCHSTKDWRLADMVEKHQTTRFPLLGRHASVECRTCHANAAQKQFSATPTDCYSCHRNDYARTTNPNHVFAGFSTNCEQCHAVTSFRWGTKFDHDQTAFPLTGAHKAARCFECHAQAVFRLTPKQCVACHQPQIAATTNPNHVAARFSTECQGCHSTVSWSGGHFDHDRTQFPLVGAHSTQQCRDCHSDNQFSGRPTDCVSCHAQAFNATTNPNHLTNNFPTTCQTCHTQTTWRPSTFNHSATAFPLTGAHQAVACAQCHRNGQYTNTPTRCMDCHRANFLNATNPTHQSSAFNRSCIDCHTTISWHPATFDHATTNFPLTGRHGAAQCQACHVNGNYQLQYTNCYPCHTAQYAQPTNPNHVLGNFNHDCAPCHTTSGWQPSTFNHGTTAFPLTGAHQATSCNGCHINNQYQGLPTTCVGCHLMDFNNTTNPNHVARGFSQQCTECHTSAAWSPASFDHSTTAFPLTGRHVTTNCVACHVNNNYNLSYQDCYQCHATQYVQPTNPNHVTLQFSHDCTPCHTTSAWRPSTYNHDVQYFRIYSGHHRNRWTTCSQCHPTIGQYQNFTCISCHEHNRTDMDQEHRNIQNYQYSSPACYNCHRNA